MSTDRESSGTDWLPAIFEHPARVDLPTGHHLRPIRASDVDIDLRAVMGSRERLWSIFGKVWGWPTPTLTYQQDLDELARHAAEIERHESFNYALLNEEEAELLGCVYIDPAERVGADADIAWWVVDSLVEGAVDAALNEFLPRWIETQWPFTHPRFIGQDLSWDEWLALPPLPPQAAR